MGWGLKNKKSILWGFLKIQFLEDGSGKKPYIGGLLKRGVLWTVCRFKRGLVEKEGVAFLREMIPQYTL